MSATRSASSWTATVRELRRRPVRSAATVAVLALSVAALGVLAVPTISSATLSDLAEGDAMAHITLDVTPITDPELAGGGPFESIPGVTQAETRIETAFEGPDGDAIEVVGIDPREQAVNVVSATDGRLPVRAGEALVTPALLEAGHGIGESFDGPGGPISVVGVGNTASLDAEPAVVMAGDAVAALVGSRAPAAAGANTVLLRLENPSAEALDQAVADVRALLHENDIALTGFPELNVDGAHPLAEEISMVSVMIGMLGAVSGIVAMVLLASTTSAIIADRSAEVAVLRAMGSGPRATRRQLHRIATTTAALAAIVGIPLGLAVANFVSRMVLERFAAITPAVGVSIPLVLGSLAFLLVGARLVSTPAARRLVSRPLASALRDSDGRPYGMRWYQRLASRASAIMRAPLGLRVAGGNSLARPGRTLALTLQVTAAVAAVLIVASLGTSIADFGEAELEPWQYQEMTYAVGPGDGWETSVSGDRTAARNGEESGLFSYGSFDDFEIDAYGLLADTTVIDRAVVEGRWFEATSSEVTYSQTASSEAVRPEAVVTEGFARHRGISVGDSVTLELPSGNAEVEVVGIHRLRAAAFFLEREALGSLLGRPDTADVVWTTGDPGPLGQPGPLSEAVAADLAVEVDSPADMVAEDAAARDMIMGIFWAIGIVVAAVAAIGFASSLQMLVHDRRRELAAVRAAGASCGLVRRLVLAEAMWVAAIGAAVGTVLAHFGATALMAFVESSESIEIGYAYASAMVVPVVSAALLGAALLAILAVRPVLRSAPAALLRTAD